MSEPVTLEKLQEINARYQFADMAIEAAVDAEQGWDESKIRALLRSRQDVSTLHDFALHVLRDNKINGVKVVPETPTIPK